MGAHNAAVGCWWTRSQKLLLVAQLQCALWLLRISTSRVSACFLWVLTLRHWLVVLWGPLRQQAARPLWTAAGGFTPKRTVAVSARITPASEHLSPGNHCGRGGRKIVRARGTENLLWDCGSQPQIRLEATSIKSQHVFLSNNKDDTNRHVNVDGEKLVWPQTCSSRQRTVGS